MFLYSIYNKSFRFIKMKNRYMSTEINQMHHLLDNIKRNSKFLLKKNSVFDDTWEDFRKCMLMNCDEATVDFTILNDLCKTIGPNAGIAYYKYLKNNNYNPELHTTIKYLELYKLKSNDTTEEDEKNILSIYNDLMNEYKSFDFNITNALCIALNRVNKWVEALNVIKRFEEQDKSIISGHYYLISCLFDNGQDTLAYQYLINVLKKCGSLSIETYTTYLTYCTKDKSTFGEKIERMFTLWSTYGVKPNKGIALEYMIACNNHGWLASEAQVTRLICSVCGKDTSEVYLSDANYKELVQMMSQYLINHLYTETEPTEVKNFMEFIDKHKPYDIVVDVLNIKYQNRLSELYLSNAVQKLKATKQKVLLIGRKHVYFQIEKLCREHKVDSYIVQNWSNDDIFVLYAALLSGRKAKVFSHDFMRINAFNTAEQRVLFKKWQLIHHYVLSKNFKIVKLCSHKPVDSVVAKHGSNWHIPYLVFDHPAPTSRHIQPFDWICINTSK